MKLKYALLSLCLLTTVNVLAQHSQSVDTSKKRHSDDPTEKMPVAGYDLGEYLSNTLHYPDTARAQNIEGRVLVKFIVNEDGHISNCVVTKGIGGGCDEEALRVVRIMPPWHPGIQKGKPVKVYFTIPIVFKLIN